jgi:hypothetical protein
MASVASRTETEVVPDMKQRARGPAIAPVGRRYLRPEPQGVYRTGGRPVWSRRLVCSYQRAAGLAYLYHRTMGAPNGEPNVPTWRDGDRTAGER